MPGPDARGYRPLVLTLPWPTADALGAALREAPPWSRLRGTYRGYAVEQARRAAWEWEPEETDCYRLRLHFRPPVPGQRVNQVRVLLSVIRALKEAGVLLATRQVVEVKMAYSRRSQPEGSGVRVWVQLLSRGRFAIPVKP